MLGAKVRLCERDKKGNIVRKYDFGQVQSITTDYATSLTQMPIVIFGPKNTLLMDTGGVGKTYRISFTRISPANPSIADPKDTEEWSNEAWSKELKGALSHWQMRTDGFQFILEMPKEMSDCFPDLNDNVYVNSITLPLSNDSTMAISGSIMLSVGTIGMDKPTPAKMLTLTYYPNYDGTKAYPFTSTMSEKPTGGATMILSSPKVEWVDEQKQNLSEFINWNTQADGKGDSYTQGQKFDITADTSLYAKWAKVLKISLITSDMPNKPFPFQPTTKFAAIYAFGGGGGGTPSFSGPGNNNSELMLYGGGGGNGGRCAKYVLDLRTQTTVKEFTYTLGKGGAGAAMPLPYDKDSVCKGEAGTSTKIPELKIVGEGGEGGIAVPKTKEPGSGDSSGPYGTKGGTGAVKEYSERRVRTPSTDGEGPFGGKGGSSVDSAGSGGGGSPQIEEYYSYFKELDPSKRPHGGDGASSTKGNTAPAQDGFNGGGGGGGIQSEGDKGRILYGAKGGDGMILVVEYDE